MCIKETNDIVIYLFNILIYFNFELIEIIILIFL